MPKRSRVICIAAGVYGLASNPCAGFHTKGVRISPSSPRPDTYRSPGKTIGTHERLRHISLVSGTATKASVMDVEEVIKESGVGGGVRLPDVAILTEGPGGISDEGIAPPRRSRKGKEPELLDGDMLENTPKMVTLVYTSLFLNSAVLIQALSTVTSPLQALWVAVGGFVGYLIADLVSGVFHWSVDNYGDGKTPVFGTVIEAFQGHHAFPWTITHRPFENNVHKIAYAVLPLLALLKLADLGAAGVACGVTFLVGSLMSNEFHRYAHMTDPPPVVSALQRWGVIVSRKEHGKHHRSPFEGKYCIVSGMCNGPLDQLRVFRLMERIVYRLGGAEPIAWKLDPSVKGEALSMASWLPLTDREIAAKRSCSDSLTAS